MRIRKNRVLRVVRPDRLERPTFWFVVKQAREIN